MWERVVSYKEEEDSVLDWKGGYGVKCVAICYVMLCVYEVDEEVKYMKELWKVTNKKEATWSKKEGEKDTWNCTVGTCWLEWWEMTFGDWPENVGPCMLTHNDIIG